MDMLLLEGDEVTVMEDDKKCNLPDSSKLETKRISRL